MEFAKREGEGKIQNEKNINVLVVDISPIMFQQMKLVGIFAPFVFGENDPFITSDNEPSDYRAVHTK